MDSKKGRSGGRWTAQEDVTLYHLRVWHVSFTEVARVLERTYDGARTRFYDHARPLYDQIERPDAQQVLEDIAVYWLRKLDVEFSEIASWTKQTANEVESRYHEVINPRLQSILDLSSWAADLVQVELAWIPPNPTPPSNQSESIGSCRHYSGAITQPQPHRGSMWHYNERNHMILPNPYVYSDDSNLR